MKRRTTQQLKAYILASLLVLSVACAKRLPDEPADAYKKRAAAILIAQTATGLDAFSDAVAVLVAAGKASKATGAKQIEFNQKLAAAWKVIKDRLQNGVQCAPLPGQDASKSVCTVDLIASLADDLLSAQEAGIFSFDEATTTERFQIFVLGLKSSVLALKGFFRNKSDPNAAQALRDLHAANTKLRAAQNNPQWVFDLINITIVAGQTIQQQSNFLTANQAFSNADTIYLALVAKNQKRLTEYQN